MIGLRYIDLKDAMEHGVNEAFIIMHLKIYVRHSIEKNVNFEDGRYWTFRTRSLIASTLPFLNKRQIGYALEKLVKKGYLLCRASKNDNGSVLNYYSFADQKIEEDIFERECIDRNEHIKLAEPIKHDVINFQKHENSDGIGKKFIEHRANLDGGGTKIVRGGVTNLEEGGTKIVTYKRIINKKKINIKGEDVLIASSNLPPSNFSKKEIELIEHWNQHGPIKHKHDAVILKDLPKLIKKVPYDLEAIKQAIINYSSVCISKDTWWSHKWNLTQFLQRKSALAFYGENFIAENYKRNNNSSSQFTPSKVEDYNLD